MDGNAYSVPWRLIGERVRVTVSGGAVRVAACRARGRGACRVEGAPRPRRPNDCHLAGIAGTPGRPVARMTVAVETEYAPRRPTLLRPLAEYEARSPEGVLMSGHDHLIGMLNRLKLTALRDQLDSLIDEAGRRELTIRDALALFCEREIARRDQRRIEMGFGLARFPFVRDLAGFDFAAQPSIDKAQIREIWRPAGSSPTARPCCCSGRRASARRIWPSRSAARRSWPATRCCSRRRRRWWRSWPRRMPTAASRSA